MKSLEYSEQRSDTIFLSCKRISLFDVWKIDDKARGTWRARFGGCSSQVGILVYAKGVTMLVL